MDTNLTLSLQDRLGQFRSEGYAVAQRFSGEHAISPSSASTMLARDFAGE